MRRQVFLVVVAVLAGGCPGGDDKKPKVPEPVRPSVCPKGETPRTVPILYGPLKQDPKTRQARWDRKFVYGGLTAKPDAPRVTRVCGQYAQDPLLDQWTRESHATDGFTPPLSAWISRAPTFDRQHTVRPGMYRHTLRKGVSVEESYSAATSEPVGAVWARIRKAAASARGVRIVENTPDRKWLRGTMDRWQIEAVVERGGVTNGTEIRLRAW